MSAQTGISWCDSTFNPWIGCTKVGPGCDHCYAERDMDIRRGRAKWGAGNLRSRTSALNWKLPLRWEHQAGCFVQCTECSFRGTLTGWGGGRSLSGHGCKGETAPGFRPARRRVFCASLADVFDNEVDPAWRMALFAMIASTPNLDWLLLTKRIGNVMSMCSRDSLMFDVIRERIWLGATVVNQQEADRDIEKLMAIPARVRFLSMEPLLGPVDISQYLEIETDNNGPIFHPLHWVIVGGESGPQARPMQRQWARDLRDQCSRAGVPFHFKQWGEHAPNWFVSESRIEVPDSMWMSRVGKKLAGRELDGRTWDEFPRAAQ